MALGGGRLHAGAADFEYERGAVLQVREVLIRPREPEVSAAADLEEDLLTPPPEGEKYASPPVIPLEELLQRIPQGPAIPEPPR